MEKPPGLASVMSARAEDADEQHQYRDLDPESAEVFQENMDGLSHFLLHGKMNSGYTRSRRIVPMACSVLSTK